MLACCSNRGLALLRLGGSAAGREAHSCCPSQGQLPVDPPPLVLGAPGTHRRQLPHTRSRPHAGVSGTCVIYGTLAAVVARLCTSPVAASTAGCTCMGKDHWMPFLTWCSSGSATGRSSQSTPTPRMVATTICALSRRPCASCWVIAASNRWCRRCRNEDRRPSGRGPPRRQPDEALHRHAVVERVFHRRVAEVVEQLHAVNPQPQGQRIGGPPALAWGRPGGCALRAAPTASAPPCAREKTLFAASGAAVRHTPRRQMSLRVHRGPHRISLSREHRPRRATEIFQSIPRDTDAVGQQRRAPASAGAYCPCASCSS